MILGERFFAVYINHSLSPANSRVTCGCQLTAQLTQTFVSI